MSVSWRVPVGVALRVLGSAMQVTAQERDRQQCPTDGSFAGVQERGRGVMGVDQYASTHMFDSTPAGGRIELQSDTDDPAAIAQIRTHLQQQRDAFVAGDFANPAEVHAGAVPGSDIMAARRSAITYTFRELPRGGEIVIATRDAHARAAIHDFLAFQRSDHRAQGLGGDGTQTDCRNPHQH